MNALNGTGPWDAAEPAELAPPDAPAVAPSAALDVVDARDVPARDVFALEEMLPDALLTDSTLPAAFAFADGSSAEVELTLEVSGVEPIPPATKADVEDGGTETPAVDAGANNAFPAEGVTPAPAPEDEPAVLEATAEDEVPASEDWM